MVQKFSFNSFVFASLQEVEQYRLPGLGLLKDKMIDLAVCRLSSCVTSSRSDEAVAAVVRVSEPLMKITSLADI